MGSPVVEPIVSHRQKLGELSDEIAAASRLRSGARYSRALLKKWSAAIADGMGFALLDGADVVGLLLYSSDYELRFSSFLSAESAEELPKSVTIFACHVLERARDGAPSKESLLLHSAISRLRTVGSIETIAIQTEPLYQFDIRETTSQMGFLDCRRVEMERQLSASLPEAITLSNLKIESPKPGDARDLMSVIYQGYFSEIDGYLFPDIAAVCSRPKLFDEFISSRSIHRGASMIARVHGYPSGCVLVLSGGERRKGLIGVVATLPAMRRRGIARAMLVHVLSWLKEHRHERAALAVTFENQPAFKLYSSLGFREVAPRKSISVWRRSVSRPLITLR